MADITAAFLLTRAQALYDAAQGRLEVDQRSARRADFVSGGEWMRLAIGEIRGAAPNGSTRDFNRLGLLKYGLASTAAALAAVVAAVSRVPALLVLCPLAFYAVEARFVFLFPLALDGCAPPFDENALWLKRAGGTLAVMSIVMPIALRMLLGGFVGRGFVRSWCVGCLAICVWYEELRSLGPLPVPANHPRRPRQAMKRSRLL